MISLLVGSLLTFINQYDAIIIDSEFSVPIALLTYVVPFFVSLYSSISASRN